NHGLEQANLVVKSAIVNEGPTLKRFRPRAKGSASQILKRTSHFKVVLAALDSNQDSNTFETFDSESTTSAEVLPETNNQDLNPKQGEK
ncbi:large ribosomal subunit protein uL22, partial [Mesomycoplasma ovipneumoniae]